MKEQTSILLAFSWHDPRLFRGIGRYANEQGWHVSPHLFASQFIPHGWSGDGAITSYGRGLGKFIRSLEMPKVDITVWEMDEPVPRVVVDNQAVGRLAARHFLERGFKHFAYYTWSAINVNRIRRLAFFSALEDEGVGPDSIFEIRQPPNTVLPDWERYQEAILSQVNRLPRPVAVFTGQENLAAILIDACVRNGIHIPEEIAVLGVDNIEFLCECIEVPLSSIDTQLEVVGYRAAQQLDRLMRGEITREEPPVLIAPKGIVNRQSTDVLAVSHPAVVEALQFIKRSFANAITLDDIGAHVGMSKRGMEKAFLKHLNRSPSAELRRVRLDHAKRMLTGTNEKVETVARECGYSNSSNLSFAFNKDTGMSPRMYRKTFTKT